MIILSIETSCDDTAIAIVEEKKGKTCLPAGRFKILSNIISSQIELHKEYGGVFPSLAKREHENNLVPVFEKALKKAKNLKIDVIAVTVGPGLDPCLWTGINFAKSVAIEWGLPIIPVNHIEGHLLVNSIDKEIKYPAIGLIVSGGHTQLILIKGVGKYKILGETRDDAAGECLDKAARILGLDYPGGPAIAKQAQGRSKTSTMGLPRPMMHTKDYDFSFSGLKTAVLYNFKKQSPKVRKSEEYIQSMCFEIQQSVIDVLIKKTMKAVKDYEVRTLILGGGVSANKELRSQFKKVLKSKSPNTKYLIPDTKYSTDNAVMIAIAGYYNRAKKTKNYSKIKAKPNLRIK